MIGKNPRLRLYTTLSQYFYVARHFLGDFTKSGERVTALETKIKTYIGVDHAVFLPMARVGVYLALREKVKPGQYVVMSPYTIADIVNMVVSAGGIPLFVDIEKETCSIDANQVEKILNDPEFSNIGAVMITHFYGHLCDAERIAQLCREKGIFLLEDCAQSFGATRKGKQAGSYGDAAVYSFGLYKTLTSFIGGMLVTKDEKLADALRQEVADMKPLNRGHFLKFVIKGIMTDLVTWGLFFKIVTFNLFRYGTLNNIDAINNKMKIDLNPKISHEIPEEYLYRPTDFQADQILKQLDQDQSHNMKRLAKARIYYEGLKDMKGVILPSDPLDGSNIYWYYPIQVSNRDAVVADVLRAGVDMAVSHHKNCADLPCYTEFYRDVPNAKETANSVIYLPTYPAYPEKDAELTVSLLQKILGKEA